MNGKDIVKILGPKTLIALAVLAVITIVFAAFSYFFLLPQTSAKVGALTEARTFVDGKRSEIITLRQEYADLQSYMTDFKALEKRGFFNEQNRITARRELDRVVNDSGLIRANYEIKAARPIADINAAGGPEAAAADPAAVADPNAAAATSAAQPSGNYKLVVSPIQIEFEAFDDVQVYNFIKRMQDTFQGHIGLRNFTIRPGDVFNQDTYLLIGNGQTVSLINGEMTLLWYNIIPSEKVSVVEAPQ